MASGKEIRFGVEGRAAMLKGVDLLADAVQVSCYCAGGRRHAVVCCMDADMSSAYCSKERRVT
jgi:hypothetical protein